MTVEADESRAPLPSVAELHALADKYDALAELRRSKARGDPEPARDAWRAIARAHPGALKELELLELEELDARRHALRSAAEGAREPEPWMGWIAGYHALLREAQIHRSENRGVVVGMGNVTELAVAATVRTGMRIDGPLLMKLTKPPGGRLIPVIVAAVAAAHRVPEEDVQRVVGARRQRP